MAEQIDLKAVEQKVQKGEKLTPAEIKEVMSMPPEGYGGLPSEDPDDNLPESHFKTPEETPKKAAEPAKAAEPVKTTDQAGKEPVKAAEAPKKADPEPVQEADPMARLQAELAKPDGQENLKGWTPAETAYFWEMKRERKRAQAAQAEADVLKREKLQRDIADKKAKEDAAAKEIDDVLKDKDPEDTVKVKDVQKILEGQKKQNPKDTGEPAGRVQIDQTLLEATLKAHDQIARQECGEDYDATLECSDEIIANNPVYLEQINRALRKGENTAKLAYTLIKSDPEYAKVLPIAKARLAVSGGGTKESAGKDKAPGSKEVNAEALAAQQALETNGQKVKTSAHTTSEEATASKTYGGYTADQLFNMSDANFAKVEKKHRDAFLRDMSGV